PVDLRCVDIDVLRRAVEIYLQLAYPNGVVPEPVRRRLEWPSCDDVDTLIHGPPFEKAGRNKTSGAASFALRLGNARYPHMKLQIQPWPNAAGYMLSVNTHDQVLSLDPESADLPAFREIQEDNQRLKEQIEHAWDAAGLPTFLRYLREYIEQRTGRTLMEHAPTPPDASDAE
ncbi:MAG: hypothetical protein U0794_23435, partial [Isosphaeraceae bacterium]